MTDYRDFVALERPQWAVDRGVDPDLTAFSGHNQRAIEQALEEIASTPEGAELLEQAAARGPDGIVHVMYNDDGYSLAFTPNDFSVGEHDSTFQYFSPETGGYHDLSIQRLVVHELQHLALGHTSMTMENESEAVRATNEFMEKYYGEPPRDEDAMQGRLEGGTRRWDINPNFNRANHASLDIDGLPQGPFDGIAASDQSLLADAQMAGIDFDPSIIPSDPGATHVPSQNIDLSLS